VTVPTFKLFFSGDRSTLKQYFD